MKRKKIYHIHTDFKFIYDSQRFDVNYFDNKLIIIDYKTEFNSAYHTTGTFFVPDEKNLEHISKILEDADFVVFYGLGEFKMKLLMLIPEHIKVAWRFFGYEYYSSRRDLMLSYKTLEVVENKNINHPDWLFKILIYLKFMKRNLKKNNLKEVTKRFDYILLFAEDEYKFLEKYWYVPEFIKLNIDFHFDYVEYKKTNNLIIGNSRNVYNNHLDILEIIDDDLFREYSFDLFFNYGDVGNYSSRVIDKISHRKNVNFIQDFLSREEFDSIYQYSSALIINSYRQLALGNIYTAIRYGVKIYLNEKNPVMHWLKKNDIFISSVAELRTDLKTNNIQLSREESIHNIKMFNKIAESFTKEEFCSKIYQLI